MVSATPPPPPPPPRCPPGCRTAPHGTPLRVYAKLFPLYSMLFFIWRCYDSSPRPYRTAILVVVSVVPFTARKSPPTRRSLSKRRYPDIRRSKSLGASVCWGINCTQNPELGGASSNKAIVLLWHNTTLLTGQPPEAEMFNVHHVAVALSPPESALP